MKRKTLLFILGLVCYIPIFAATAERIKVGDLYYNIIDKTNKQVEVTYDVKQSSTNYAGLIDVSIPETILYDDVTYSVVGIGSSSFRDCSTLVAITIPHSITYIESAAFEYCEQIVSVVIPNSVYKIGYHAFCNATKLSTITFPDTINEMGAGSFAGTAWYKSKPNGIVYAGNVLYYYR